MPFYNLGVCAVHYIELTYHLSSSVNFVLLFCVHILKPISFTYCNVIAFLLLTFVENQERFYWYLIAIVTATVLLCLILVIGRLIIQRRRDTSDDTKAEPSNSGDTQLPNGFSDDISEIDADIDLQTSLPSGLHHNVNKHDVGSFSHFLLLCTC